MQRRQASGEVSRPGDASVALALLHAIFGREYARRFAVALWDGTREEAREREEFTLCVNEPGALRAAFSPPADLNAGRAFAAGLIDVRGDLESAVDALYRAGETTTPARALDVIRLTRRLPKPDLPQLREASMHGAQHSLARDRQAIGFHYDLPVEFFASFLDSSLTYSCAYYADGVDSLEAAQRAKIDYVLRKLRLRAGERLLDIGCGWGGLVVRAAELGATVLGITLSAGQCGEARRRIAAAGLEGRARVELRDYRELGGERFEKIVSVGMCEHVGGSRIDEYFRAAFDALEPGGLFLNHGIANQAGGSGKASGFIERFIFPDGELLSISRTLRSAEAQGFEVRDVENLREHYARTLRAWVANLERGREAAIAAASEPVYRAWRLYMAGSAQGFRSGRMGLFQSLLARRDAAGAARVPATRSDLYR